MGRVRRPSVVLVAHAGAYGGVLTHLNHFAAALSRHAEILGVRLNAVTKHVIYSQSVYQNVTLVPSTTICRWATGLFGHLLRIPIGFLLELWRRMTDRVFAKAEATVIISHDPNAFWGYVLFARRAVYCLYVTPLPSSSWFKHICVALWRWLLHTLANHKLNRGTLTLVAPTQFAADSLRSFLMLPDSPIELLPTPPCLIHQVRELLVDGQGSNPNLESIKTLQHEGKHIILAVGHLEEYKNPVGWAQCALALRQKFKDIVFVWAGDGTLAAEVQAYVQGDAGIILAGRFNQKELQELYAMSWAFFHPATKESQGIVIMDALTYGLPVILNNQDALPELVTGHDVGYVLDFASNDILDRLSNAIKELQEHDCYAHKRQAALQLAQERFSYEKWDNKIGALFR